MNEPPANLEGNKVLCHLFGLALLVKCNYTIGKQSFTKLVPNVSDINMMLTDGRNSLSPPSPR